MSDTDGGQPTLSWAERAAGAAGRAVRALLAATRTSWPVTVTPRTRTDAWQASTVDVTRIPQAVGAVHAEVMWKISNATDRLTLFGLAALARPVAHPHRRRLADRGRHMSTTTHRRPRRGRRTPVEPAGYDEQTTDDDATSAVDDNTPEPAPAEPNVVGEAFDVYRRHLVPWAWLNTLAAAGAVVAHHHIPFVVVVPAAAAGVAGMYWWVKSRGHAAAEDRGRLDAGQLAGRHVDNINTRAARAVRHAAAAGVWLLLVNLTAPFSLLGWAVWWLIGMPLWLYVSVPAWAAAERRRLRLAPDPHHYDRASDDERPAAPVPTDPHGDTRPVEDTVRLPRQPRHAPNDSSGYQLPSPPPGPAKPRPHVDLTPSAACSNAAESTPS
jgi:hypothetical protein